MPAALQAVLFCSAHISYSVMAFRRPHSARPHSDDDSTALLALWLSICDYMLTQHEGLNYCSLPASHCHTTQPLHDFQSSSNYQAFAHGNRLACFIEARNTFQSLTHPGGLISGLLTETHRYLQLPGMLIARSFGDVGMPRLRYIITTIRWCSANKIALCALCSGEILTWSAVACMFELHFQIPVREYITHI